MGWQDAVAIGVVIGAVFYLSSLGWKGLIVASSVAFLAIPPITWRYLQRTHETEV